MMARAASETSSTFSATAPSDTRAAVIESLPVDRQVDPHAHHGDVHLGARDEAEVRVGRALGPRWQEERRDQLALGEGQLPGTDHDVLDRHVPPALRPDHGRRSSGGDEGGDAVGGRRAVAEVATQGGATLDLGRADEIGSLDDARPFLLEPGVLLELGSGDGRADSPAAPFLDDRARLTDLLDVDDQFRFDDVGAHLHQQVGASREHARLALRSREQGDRSLQRLWGLVSHRGGVSLRLE